jgi:glycosyltransferase involved in cell wall biosynthesis
MVIRKFYVDLTVLENRATGVSIYAKHLAAYLEENFDCTILVPSYLVKDFRRVILCPDPIFFKETLVGRSPLMRQRLGIHFRSDSFVYAPHMHGYLSVRNQVITIHDMIHKYHKTRNLLENAFNTYILPRIACRATGIVTVSQTSRAEIGRALRIPGEKVAVVGNGLDLQRWQPASAPSRAEGPAYLLAVSANRPYKNTTELIDHHDLWSARYRLKIVCNMAEYRATLKNAVAAAGLQHRIDFYENLSEEALIELYQNCAAAVYPSSIEGFGRPALEAMAVGRPAILSDIPVHRELFGSAAIFITPGDRAAWQRALCMLDDQRELERLVAAGLVVARQFGWDRIGQDLKHTLLRFEPQLAVLCRNP